MKNSTKLMLLGAVGCFSIVSTDASAQQYAGPLLPHVGGQVTTAFANRYGPDAEGYVTFAAIAPEQITLNYSSTRGLNVRRHVRNADRQALGQCIGLLKKYALSDPRYDLARNLRSLSRRVALQG